MSAVLDSWAVLRLLEGREPVASRVQHVLDHERSVMSWINVGEVFYIVMREQGPEEAEAVVRDLRPLLRLEMPTEQRVIRAARIKADNSLAYADAFAAATALAYDARLLTGDPELLFDGSPWKVEDLRSGPP